jgi:hypothetical protein
MRVGELSREELLALIDEAVERKLAEMLGDPDAGEIRPEVRERLLAQQAAVQAGERGISLMNTPAAGPIDIAS